MPGVSEESVMAFDGMLRLFVSYALFVACEASSKPNRHPLKYPELP